MSQDNTPAQQKWHENSHASLCLLGSYLHSQDFFHPLEPHVHLHQKTLEYTPVQKLEMLFVSLLSGAQAVSHTNFTLRADPALFRVFGLPGCAEQSGSPRPWMPPLTRIWPYYGRNCRISLSATVKPANTTFGRTS